MSAPNLSQQNQVMLNRAIERLKELAARMFSKGKHGVIGVSLHIQDGTANHLKSQNEQVEK